MKAAKYLFGIVGLIVVTIAVFILYVPGEPSYQSHTMKEWLRILETKPFTPEETLKIVRICHYQKLKEYTFELPMSYDLLGQHGFLIEGNARFNLVIDHRVLSSACERETNGNCILTCDANDVHLGTNEIHAEFWIFNPSNIDRMLIATGPVTNLVSANVAPSSAVH